MLRATLVILLNFWLMSSLSAAPLPWDDRPYSHFADQEPLVDMLSTLAANEKTAVVISPKIKDVVSVHFKERTVKAIFDEIVDSYGLTWYFDKETLYIYKEDEVKNASVSLKSFSPSEFTDALKRLQIYDPKFKWEVSEVDNVIKFTGPDSFIDVVLSTAQLMDTQASEKRIYKWRDAQGKVHYSSDRPTGLKDLTWDVKAGDKYPGGIVVLDVIKTDSKQAADTTSTPK